MNSPLPFSIASPPFLRRYAEPSFPSHSSLHSLFPYNYFFLFFFYFFFPPPPPYILSIGFPGSQFLFLPLNLRSTPLLYPQPTSLFPSLFPISLFSSPSFSFFFPSFFFSFFFLSFFFNYYPLSFFSSSSPSYPLARTLPFSAPLSFSVVLCIFLLFSFITVPSPPPFPSLPCGRFCVGGSHLSLCHSPHNSTLCRRIVLYIYIYVCTCVCVCGRKRERGRAPCRQ